MKDKHNYSNKTIILTISTILAFITIFIYLSSFVTTHVGQSRYYHSGINIAFGPNYRGSFPSVIFAFVLIIITFLFLIGSLIYTHYQNNKVSRIVTMVVLLIAIACSITSGVLCFFTGMFARQSNHFIVMDADFEIKIGEGAIFAGLCALLVASLLIISCFLKQRKTPEKTN